MLVGVPVLHDDLASINFGADRCTLSQLSGLPASVALLLVAGGVAPHLLRATQVEETLWVRVHIVSADFLQSDGSKLAILSQDNLV